MTLQIVVLNKNRSFAITESRVTIDGCKTYDGEQKMFNISDKLSCVLLVSGNSRFDGNGIKNFIDEYSYKTDIDKIDTIQEIKNTLNRCISSSSHSLGVDEYVKNTFPSFENEIRNSLDAIDDKSACIQYLKLNSSNSSIDVLDNNGLLNSRLSSLTNSLFDIIDKKEFNEIKYYLKCNYYWYLIENSSVFTLVGYDECYNNPTCLCYNILANLDGKLLIVEKYELLNCNSTMTLTFAQDDDVELNLMGFNEDSYYRVQKIVFELFGELDGSFEFDESTFKTIGEKLKIKIDNQKLDNLKNIVDFIEVSPDFEILKLLDVLVELTEIKMKFSDSPNSVGGKRVKAVLRKYEGVKFIE